MTPIEQRIAIAEACGLEGPWQEKITDCGCEGQWDYYNPAYIRLPDYPGNLNAMHEAEKYFDDKPDAMRLTYYVHIMDIAENFPIQATAAQRAQAFLKTLGKWE